MDSDYKGFVLPENNIKLRSDDYRLIFGREITADNIRAALDIDYLSYDDIYHLDLERCIGYHQKNPYIYIMALDENDNVIGYINFSPVNDKIYEVMRSGTSVDTIITADDIMEYEAGKAYSVYCSSICVHPDHRNSGVAKLMISGLEALISQLDQSDVVIKRMVADAVTDLGFKILLDQGFSYVGMSEHGSKIMEKIRYA